MKRKPVWTETEVRQMIASGIDRDRLDALHAQAMYALTGKLRDRWRTSGHGLWPVYLDYAPNRVEIGNSRMILNSSRILLSEFSGVIEPQVLGVDKVTAAQRCAAWTERSRGDGMTDGGWDVEMASQYTDFRELGSGVVFHDTLEDEDGLEYETLRHYRATDVVYDRAVRNPLHAKWVCRRTCFTKFEAIATFGEENVHLESLDGSGGSYPLEVVWFYEFFSVPFAGRRETYCSFVGMPEDGKCFQYPRTARTKELPCSWGVNYLPAGAMWPIGGVWLQAATQALLNNLEAKFRKASDRQGMTGVDLRVATPENLKTAQETGWLKMSLAELGPDPDIRRAVVNIEGGQISRSDLEMYEISKRQYNEDSGLTDQMRGNLSDQDRTLGEQQMAQMGAEKGQSYEKTQALAMTMRTVEKKFDRFQKFDRSPLLIDYDGFDIVLNDPDDDRLSMENVFAKKGRVKIDPGSFAMSNQRLKMAQRAAELSDPAVLMLVQQGAISMEWYRDEVMKTKGETDPNDYAPEPMAQGQGQDRLGQIGQLLTGLTVGQSNSGQKGLPAGGLA